MNLVSKCRLLAIPVALVFVAVGMPLAGSIPARATTAPVTMVPTSAAATSLSVDGRIWGISGTSATNAWAVGVTALDSTLIAHWNGRRWTVLHDFSWPGQLTAISADSPTDAWALGADYNGNSFIIHWNGRTWTKDTSVPHVAGYLNALVAVNGDVWAGGVVVSAKTNAEVMLHRTAGRWYVVPIPAKGTASLDSFAASSRSSIWAGGNVLLHWNGAEWERTAVPKPASWMGSMSAGPHASVWAIGVLASGAGSLRWNGKAWREAPIPGSQNGGSNSVSSIASIPGGTAWVVGSGDETSNTRHPALIMHWSGKAWETVKTPTTPQPNDELVAATAISPNDAWAAGWSTCMQEHCPVYTLILHWNGKGWS